jgi:hypothetical protein
VEIREVAQVVKCDLAGEFIVELVVEIVRKKRRCLCGGN